MTDNNPIYVGYLKTRWGINGFEVAEPGHPVFDFNDRYVIFLKCLNKTVEQVPDGNGGHTKTFIEYTVIVPFYKKTLQDSIEFINQ